MRFLALLARSIHFYIFRAQHQATEADLASRREQEKVRCERVVPWSPTLCGGGDRRRRGLDRGEGALDALLYYRFSSLSEKEEERGELRRGLVRTACYRPRNRLCLGI